MNIVSDLNDWYLLRNKIQQQIGFVATMGNLHQGHLSLCQASQRENEVTVVSIFVNPTQFNQSSDFSLYPRTLDQDIVLLKKQGIDYVILPDEQAMYPDHYQIQVNETEISLELEGFFRPSHFTGMLTIVLKLLNLVQAHRAYFGEKDYQQLLLIKKMVSAFFIPTEIIACPTVRAEDGLALSSRNSRLTTAQRAKARNFPHVLQSDKSLEQIRETLTHLGFKVDYISEKWQRRLGAVWLDEIRLIDNFPLTSTIL